MDTPPLPILLPLIVKNTFLDVDDGMGVSGLAARADRRAKTVGAQHDSSPDFAPASDVTAAPETDCPASDSPESIQPPIVHTWTVDAKKLRGNDRSIVSRAFPLAFPGNDPSDVGTFKLMLCAKALRKDGKGSQSFKLSEGHGSMHLKCEQDLRAKASPSAVNIRFTLAKGSSPSGGPATRMIYNNFAQSAACVTHDWDFSQALADTSQTLMITVEFTPAS